MYQRQTEQDDSIGAGGSVRAVLRAVEVLKAFSGAQPWMTLGDLVQHTGLAKPTVRRLLLTLIEAELVTQDKQTLRYALTAKMAHFAGALPDAADLRKIASPVLRSLAQDLKAMILLSTWHEGGTLCVEKQHFDPFIDVGWWQVGMTLAFNVGAAPRVLLAYRAPEEAKRIVATGQFRRFTAATVMEAETYEKQLEDVRQQGWALAIDDFVDGLSAYAVPVFDPGGRILAAISLGGLTPQVCKNGRPRNLQRVQAAARDIEKRLTTLP